MEHLIIRYGLLAVFLGAGIEGEPFALAGGVLAQRQWCSPVAAVLAAIAGSWLIDQLWFHLSRHYRESRLTRRVADRPGFRRALALVERNPVRFVLLFRFAYGLRAVAAVAIGASRVAPRLFVPLDLLAATVWSVVFTGLGYLLGPAVEAAEARFGSALALGVIILSVLALAFAVRRGT